MKMRRDIAMRETEKLSDELLDKISGGAKNTGNCPQCHRADLTETFSGRKCTVCGYTEYED